MIKIQCNLCINEMSILQALLTHEWQELYFDLTTQMAALLSLESSADFQFDLK